MKILTEDRCVFLFRKNDILPVLYTIENTMSQTKNYLLPFAILTTLFFLWGLLTSLNDILVPHLKAAFALRHLQAPLIQFFFFGA